MPVTELPRKSSRLSQSPRAAVREAHASPKGLQTKAAIVDAALGLATQIGLEGLSIGALAEVMHMSKSGVFAHFGSREELQISVVREYHVRFEDEVFYPAMREPRGLPRLRALFANWMRRTSAEIDSGCLYIGGAVEFDDRPGARRAGQFGPDLARGHVPRRGAGPRGRACARGCGRAADGVRDSRPDPGAALRSALPENPGLDRPRQHRLRPYPGALWQRRRRPTVQTHSPLPRQQGVNPCLATRRRCATCTS